MDWVLSSLVLAAAGLVAAGRRRSTRPSTPKVIVMKLDFERCHDGDTCTVHNQEGLKMTLRLAGIDAPEVAKTRGPKKKRNKGQSYGAEAREYLNSRVDGKTLDVQILGNDVYNRYLAVLYEGGRHNINQEMIEQGYAFSYKGKSDDPEISRWADKAEADARKNRRGLWGLANPPEDPSLYRRENR
jgi:endonuclease YncB( thermonuclease family)